MAQSESGSAKGVTNEITRIPTRELSEGDVLMVPDMYRDACFKVEDIYMESADGECWEARASRGSSRKEFILTVRGDDAEIWCSTMGQREDVAEWSGEVELYHHDV